MAEFFHHTRPGRVVSAASGTFELPVLYSRDELFAAFFSADASRVRALMPCDQLRPVLLPRGRALVGVAAINYFDTSIGPYGEVAVVVPVIYGAWPRLPLLPVLLESRYPGYGQLVLHLPVTEPLARDAGRGTWGYTKFVADMQFQSTPERMECRLSEAGEHILTLGVARAGLVRRDDKPLVTYSVRDHELIRTTIPQRGIARTAFRPRGSALELGSHRVARELAALDLNPRPLVSRYFLERFAVLPEGTILERGVRALDGYRGRAVEAPSRPIVAEMPVAARRSAPARARAKRA